MESFAFSFSYSFFCLSNFVFVSLDSVIYNVVKLKKVHAPKPLTTHTSGDCERT